MKTFIFMIWTFFSSSISAQIPSWVEGLISGEERMRVQNGTSILFRRLASDCVKATNLVEEDIVREFGDLNKYKMEHVYNGDNFCAVTASVDDKVRILAPEATGTAKALERSIKAKQNAIFGISYTEFKALIKDSAPVLKANETGLCFKNFESKRLTIHGSVVVCWLQEVLVGTCSLETGECSSGK